MEVAVLSIDDIEEMVGMVDQEASTHGGDYAGGMRCARLMFEEELKDRLEESDAVVLDVKVEE